MNIAKGGLSWIITSFVVLFIFIVATLMSTDLIRYVSLCISLVLLVITNALIIFFRDPERKIGDDIVAIADGVIREITTEDDEDVGKSIKISTFMNIHNVHVNRMPLNGTIIDMHHYEGAHIPAFKKESEHNERMVILLKTDIGIIKIIQIAGAIARRIVPYVKKGDIVKKGEKIGLIRLGSRVDIYLPTKKIKQVIVHRRDKVTAGETAIAEIYD